MSTPTLHDFVLNLITDADAREAFELDPEGVLHGAGLGDITEADVRDVIPLVMDYAPIGSLPGLVGTDEPVLDGSAGVGGAVRQLQSLTDVVAVGSTHSSDGSLSATTVTSASLNLGAVPLAPAGLTPVHGWVGGGVSAPLDDPTAALDAVHPVADPVVDTVFQTADVTTGTVNSVTSVTSVTDPHPASVVDPTVHSVTHTVSGVTGTVSGVSGSVLGGDHGLGLDHSLDHDLGITEDHDGLLGHLH